MRVLIQRVSEAQVSIEGKAISFIERGLLVLLGISVNDTEDDIDWLVSKLIRMRIFSDDDGKMNLSLQEIEGGLMVVSQFTLHASTKKGNRPSFIKSARPEISEPLYRAFIRKAKSELGREIAAGEFGADMQISLVNDGPVTVWLDSRARE